MKTEYLPFYDSFEKFPTGEVMLEDLMNLCEKRLNFLKELDVTDAIDGNTLSSLVQKLYKILAPTYREFLEKPHEDKISHYFLRIAYSKNKELRDWFVKNESALFRIRLAKSFSSLNNDLTRNEAAKRLLDMLKKCQEKYGSKFQIFENCEEDIKKLKESEAFAMFLGGKSKEASIGYLKVPFEHVTRLVGKRRVIIRDGFAFIDISDSVILMENVFKEHLRENTKQTKKMIPYLEDINEIVAEFLDKIDALSSLGIDYTKLSQTNKREKINIADLDLHAKRSFPLCMREMHKHLRENHHLKHMGRLQYGLYLKGLGLTLEDSLKFWRLEFTKKMTNDKFEKGYVYNIRHSYGKEGKRTDYTPWNCTRMIQGATPGSSEHHGCPFKEYSDSNLRVLLLQVGEKLTREQVQEIITLRGGKHYQVSCRTLFEKLHPGATFLDDVGIHPNGYFEASLIFHNKIDTKKKISPNTKVEASQDSIITE